MQENVTPLLTHWSYVFLALTHRYDIELAVSAIVGSDNGVSRAVPSLYQNQCRLIFHPDGRYEVSFVNIFEKTDVIMAPHRISSDNYLMGHGSFWLMLRIWRWQYVLRQRNPLGLLPNWCPWGTPASQSQICHNLQGKKIVNALLQSRWLSTRMQYLQCVSTGDTAILH